MGEAEEQSRSQHGLCDDCCLTVRGQQSVSPIPTSALDLIDLLSLFQFSCLPTTSPDVCLFTSLKRATCLLASYFFL